MEIFSVDIISMIFSFLIIGLIIVFFVSLFLYVKRRITNSIEQSYRIRDIEDKLDKIIELLQQQNKK